MVDQAAPASEPTATYTRRAVVAPLRSFLKTESGSAGVLVAAILAALVWATIDLGSYERFWATPLPLRLGDHAVTRDLRTWVNSGLMTLFFLVVGLEARREFDLGDLRDRRRLCSRSWPAWPACWCRSLIYLAVNAGGPPRGWGVAMSTDTALALGGLSLLGRRVPDRTRVFLLTMFVVDDLASLVVIAVAYSEAVALCRSWSPCWCWPALGMLALGVNWAPAYLSPGW